MIPRSRHSLGRILGYHGCDAKLGEAVLAGKKALTPSKNSYDWLGQGIYFWVDSPERALDWAAEQSQRPNPKIKKPFVLGAFISPALCLNLTDYGVSEEIVFAFNLYKDSSKSAGLPMAINQKFRDGVSLARNLDCAVLSTLHKFREKNENSPYDSVYGVFEEGQHFLKARAFARRRTSRSL